MDYKMPTYDIDGFIHFALASQKHYMALYVMHYDLLDHFAEPLSKYNCGKSCIRFKKLEEDTFSLLREIIIYCYQNAERSTFYKRYPINK